MADINNKPKLLLDGRDNRRGENPGNISAQESEILISIWSIRPSINRRSILSQYWRFDS